MAERLNQQGEKINTDVLIIGAGIAGLSFALNFTEQYPDKKIILITKNNLLESNSRYAQGGIAAVSHKADSIENHIHDTIRAGAGLGNPEIIKKIISKGPKAIAQLIDRGVAFDQSLAREGGHGHRRIYHVGDKTGFAIIDSLIRLVKKNKNIEILENHTAVNLITQIPSHTPNAQTEVLGAYILNEKKEKINHVLSTITVLATGGAGKVFRYTSNPEVATGDGVAMAYRAGARVGNLEFFQFHPTLLHHHKLNNFLISEALRGEGGLLLRPDTGERFMQDYAPEQMELATRDIVAKAIFTEIENSNYNYVYLDMRKLSEKELKERFPTIYTTLLELGINISKDLIPVVPGAHYLCGGILTNENGVTDLKRLYAIGETAFTGLHGANRLASNSLLEGAVMALNAVEDCEKIINQPIDYNQPIPAWSSQSVIDSRRASQINALWRGLRGEMTSYAGIVRTDAGLKDLLKLIGARREMIETYYWRHKISRDLIELRNIVLLAELITRAALSRRESRGGHFREDFPLPHSQTKESIFHNKNAEVSETW